MAGYLVVVHACAYASSVQFNNTKSKDSTSFPGRNITNYYDERYSYNGPGGAGSRYRDRSRSLMRSRGESIGLMGEEIIKTGRNGDGSTDREENFTCRNGELLFRPYHIWAMEGTPGENKKSYKSLLDITKLQKGLDQPIFALISYLKRKN